jgi:hypothetical protein
MRTSLRGRSSIRSSPPSLLILIYPFPRSSDVPKQRVSSVNGCVLCRQRYSLLQQDPRPFRSFHSLAPLFPFIPFIPFLVFLPFLRLFSVITPTDRPFRSRLFDLQLRLQPRLPKLYHPSRRPSSDGPGARRPLASRGMVCRGRCAAVDRDRVVEMGRESCSRLCVRSPSLKSCRKERGRLLWEEGRRGIEARC